MSAEDPTEELLEPRGARVCDILGVGSHDQISLVIKTPIRTLRARKTLSSGHEIYGAEIRDLVKTGQTIRVTARAG